MFGSISAQSTYECTTPNNEPGVCISILKCPVLQTIILEHLYQIEYFNFLKASFCGYEGRATKVCCPLEKLLPTPKEVQSKNGGEMSAIKLPLKSTSSKIDINRDRLVEGATVNLECTTPNYESGVCISILKCPVLHTLMLEHRKRIEYINLLKASFCGYDNKTTKVCCPWDKPRPEPEEVQSRNGGEILASKLPTKATFGKPDVNRHRIVGGSLVALG